MNFNNTIIVDSSQPAGLIPAGISNSLEDPRLSLDDPSTWDGVLGGTRASSGVLVTPERALGYPPFWRGVSLLSGDVAKLPLNVMQRQDDNGKEVDRQHAAHRLLRRRPNQCMTAYTFKRTLMLHALMHGNGCAAIFRDRAFRPTGLMILDPQETCRAIVEGEDWYVTNIGGEQRKIQAENVLHIKGLSHNGMWGIDVIDIMRDQLGLGIASRDYGAKFFDGDALAAGVLMVPGHFSEAKIKYTLSAWKTMASGLAQSHKVALLQDGVKYQQISVTPEQAQFLQTRQFERVEVANILGIPPHKLGDSSKASHNSLEQENASYLDESLDPWLIEWEEECGVKLLTEEEQDSDSHFVAFNRSARLRTDAKTRAEVHRIYAEIGVNTTNDMLRLEDRPTIGEAGEQRFRPANWVPLDAETADDVEPAENQQERARLALQNAIVDRIERLAQIEHRKAEKATGPESSDESRREWAEKFYSSFAEQMAQALRPVVIVAYSLADRETESEQVLQQFIARYTANRMDEIRSGSLTPHDPRELAAQLLPQPETD